MKKLIKLVSMMTILMIVSVNANAQFKIGANLGLGFPMGDFGDMVKTGFGGEFDIKYMLNENMSIGLGVGTYSFGVDVEGADASVSITPIVAKYNYYFGESAFKPYLGADLGLYMAGGDVESSTDFGFAPVVGCEYAFNESWAFNANLKYNYIATENEATTLLGINVGIVYSFGGQ